MLETPTSLAHALRTAADEHPDREAIVDATERWTYRDLDGAAFDTCRALIGMGVQPGDRVAIWAQNCARWCIAALGIIAARAVVVPINSRFRGGEAAQLINDSRATALFTTTGFLGADYPDMLRATGQVPGDLPIVVINGDATTHDLTWEAFLAGGTSVDATEAKARTGAAHGDDISDIMYTSGTTGFPKGVVQTHRKNLIAMGALARAVGMHAGDRNLILAPLFAQFGLRGGLYMDIMVGATTVLESTFDPDRIIDLVERERITILPGPPTVQAAFLSEEAQRRDITSLRVALVGSTTIPEDLVHGLLDNKVFDHVVTAYGLTEACGAVTASSMEDPPARIATTSGRAFPHVEMRVVDEEGTSLPPGGVGELLVRSPTLMNCYLEDPEHTAEALDPTGWLHTGDIGTIDAEGYLQIVGRRKEMFIVGGFNVYPAEVERIIREHEAVHDVALVGVPDDRLGEVGAAFVVAESGHRTEQLYEWCKNTLANYRVPRILVELDELPLNTSLKVDKLALRRRAAQLWDPALGQRRIAPDAQPATAYR